MTPKTSRLTKIKKRDGRLVKFDQSKIKNAIFKAGLATKSFDEKEAARISRIVVEIVRKTLMGKIPEVEQVQDIVEQCLMAADHYEAAKAYILYRKEHEKMREEKAILGVVDDLGLPLNALRVLKARHLRRNEEGQTIETPRQLFERVAKAVAGIDKNYGLSDGRVQEYAAAFYQLMAERLFIPGGSYLRSAGLGGPLSNCHVLPIHDNIESIYEIIKLSAILNKTAGGGVGYNFSHLRPAGDFIRSSGGLATGPISFMRVIDASTEVIGMGGYRKGACMGILNVDHPDILDFIHSKRGGQTLNTFNISVGVTDKFMRATIKGVAYDLINPRNQKKVGQLNARGVFGLICALAHENGDPGLLFLDTTNKTNPLPRLGRLETTNICGEQWLHPYDVCNLGSINLAKFVQNGRVNFKSLERVIILATRFMDNGVDLSQHPILPVHKMAKSNRRIGLGVMGWADMLIQLKIAYDSDEALKLARRIMKFINETAFQASQELAKEKGVFKNHPLSIYKKQGVKIRNASRTTIAPTGSISMVADCSSGVEPIFALVYTKNVVDAQGVFYINKYFERTAAERGFFSQKLLTRISANGTALGMKEVPKDVQRIFVTAHDIKPAWHVKMQASFQKHVDNAISKTINMPNNATVKDVEDVYLMAWRLGCKGITIYRDRSRETQILSYGEPRTDKDTQVVQTKVTITPLSQRVYPEL